MNITPVERAAIIVLLNRILYSRNELEKAAIRQQMKDMPKYKEFLASIGYIESHTPDDIYIRRKWFERSW